ncbi:MAG: hypothetical protein O7G85_08270, partial [Planctomycetota bacterium]|nr:hypothetical protein [Planctomycetota bacterium]
MEREPLEKAIHEALSELGGYARGQQADGFDLDAKIQSSAAIKLVEGVLEKMEEFQPERLPRISNGCGFISLMPYNFAALVIRVGLDRGSAGEAVAWLEKVLNMRVADGLHVLVCWGLSPKQIVQISEDVFIMPIEQLPQSVAKQNALKAHSFDGHLMPPSSIWNRPTAVLIYRVKFDPFLFRPGEREIS